MEHKKFDTYRAKELFNFEILNYFFPENSGVISKIKWEKVKFGREWNVHPACT